jgi:hypothetical protein
MELCLAFLLFSFLNEQKQNMKEKVGALKYSYDLFTSSEFVIKIDTLFYPYDLCCFVAVSAFFTGLDAMT